jgi:transcriptional regulator NrdR family protein
VTTILLTATACSRHEREKVSIQDARLVEPASLRLTLNICHAAERRVTTAETADAVTVTVTAKSQGGSHDNCADGLSVSLSDPFGSRSLVDGTTGHRLRVAAPESGAR